jgi:hypothetical protein
LEIDGWTARVDGMDLSFRQVSSGTELISSLSECKRIGYGRAHAERMLHHEGHEDLTKNTRKKSGKNPS